MLIIYSKQEFEFTTTKGIVNKDTDINFYCLNDKEIKRYNKKLNTENLSEIAKNALLSLGEDLTKKDYGFIECELDLENQNFDSFAQEKILDKENLPTANFNHLQQKTKKFFKF